MVADKMVWTKYGQNDIGQNGTDKILRLIHQSIQLSLTI